MFYSRNNNTADECTRCNPLASLTPNSLWIKEPQFLYKNEYVSFESEVPTTGSESTNYIGHLTVYCKLPHLSFINWENYSSFFKFVKHIAYILKLKHHWINKKEKLSEISAEAQRESYTTEINAITNNKPLPKTTTFLSLRPLLSDNLLRVGGGGKLDNHFYHFNQNTKLFYQKINRYQHSWYRMSMSKTATQEEISLLVLSERGFG